MNDIATATVTGRLTRDAELRYTGSGTAVCNGSIASNYSVKRGDNWEEQASFFDFVLFARRAEALSKYLKKGQQVVIKADLRQDRWTNQGGENRSKVKLYVQDLVLVGGKSDGSGQSAAPASGQQTDFEDDVPF